MPATISDVLDLLGTEGVLTRPSGVSPASYHVDIRRFLAGTPGGGESYEQLCSGTTWHADTFPYLPGVWLGVRQTRGEEIILLGFGRPPCSAPASQPPCSLLLLGTFPRHAPAKEVLSCRKG